MSAPVAADRLLEIALADPMTGPQMRVALATLDEPCRPIALTLAKVCLAYAYVLGAASMLKESVRAESVESPGGAAGGGPPGIPPGYGIPIV